MTIAGSEVESNISPRDIRDVVGTHGHELALAVLDGKQVGPANVRDLVIFVDRIHEAISNTEEDPSEWWKMRYKRLGLKASEFCRVTALVLTCFGGAGTVHRIRQDERQREIDRVNAVQPAMRELRSRVKQMTDLDSHNKREIERLTRRCESLKEAYENACEKANQEETKRLRAASLFANADATRLKAEEQAILAEKMANPIEYHCDPVDICELIAHGRVLIKY